jgi:hypothetical protein
VTCGHFADTGQESSGIVRILLGNGQQQAVDMINPRSLFQEWGSGGRWSSGILGTPSLIDERSGGECYCIDGWLVRVVAPDRYYGILKRRFSEWLFPKSVYQGYHRRIRYGVPRIKRNRSADFSDNRRFRRPELLDYLKATGLARTTAEFRPSSPCNSNVSCFIICAHLWNLWIRY